MGRILVTGGAGFIGLHLAKALHARGHAVGLLDNFARGRMDGELRSFAAQPGVHVIERDLLAGTDGLPTDYTAVVHFAAMLGVDNVRRRPFEVLTVNHRLLENALRLAAAQKDLTRFVFASTSEVYAGTLFYHGMEVPTPESTPLTVSDLREPRTTYMLSKIYGEALCIHSGLPFTVVRPHNVYGPRMGMSHVVPQLLERAYRSKDGDPFGVYSVGHSRSFCYVDDGVEMVARAIVAPSCDGQVLNIGNEAAEVTIGELAGVVLRVVGRRCPIVAREDTPGSPVRRAPHMGRTSELTGYEARVSVEEGVRRTFEWYRTRVFDGDELSAV